MRTGTRARVAAPGTAAALALVLTACGSAAPDTQQVPSPDPVTQEAVTTEAAQTTQPPGEPTSEAALTTAAPTAAPTGAPTGEAAPTTQPGPPAPGAPTPPAPTTSAPASPGGPTTGPAGGGVPIGCFNPEEIAYEAGPPSAAEWGTSVEVETAFGDRFTVVVEEPTIRELEFRLPEEPPFVWEAEVTASHVEGMGFTSVTDFVLLDPSGSQCAVAWAETTLWGLTVYREGDVESGTAAFLVPTNETADYELVFVGSNPAVAQHTWER